MVPFLMTSNFIPLMSLCCHWVLYLDNIIDYLIEKIIWKECMSESPNYGQYTGKVKLIGKCKFQVKGMKKDNIR